MASANQIYDLGPLMYDAPDHVLFQTYGIQDCSVNRPAQVLIPDKHGVKGVCRIICCQVGLQCLGQVVGVAEVEVLVELKARQQQLAVALLSCSLSTL